MSAGKHCWDKVGDNVIASAPLDFKGQAEQYADAAISYVSQH